MKIGLRAITTSILALTLASPAFGKTPYPGFERDMQMAFENGGEPMELALLSEKEMRETKGAVWPFNISWIGRLFWGASYGWLETGVNVHNRAKYNEIRTLYQISATQLMAYSLIGLASTHPAIGSGLGFAADKSFGALQKIMWENDWSIWDAVDHAATLVNRKVADLIRSGGGGSEGSSPEPMSAQPMSVRSEEFDASRYLVGLLGTFNQDKLRQFLSDIPEGTFNRVLSDVAPGTARADFLDSLPLETVNNFLAAMPGEHMPAFKSIVPSGIVGRIATATATTASGHWRY